LAHSSPQDQLDPVLVKYIQFGLVAQQIHQLHFNILLLLVVVLAVMRRIPVVVPVAVVVPVVIAVLFQVKLLVLLRPQNRHYPLLVVVRLL
jgi:hypothetical protein